MALISHRCFCFYLEKVNMPATNRSNYDSHNPYATDARDFCLVNIYRAGAAWWVAQITPDWQDAQSRRSQPHKGQQSSNSLTFSQAESAVERGLQDLFLCPKANQHGLAIFYK